MRNWTRMLGLAVVLAACGVVAGCSLLTQDQRKVVWIDPASGEVLVWTEGAQIGDEDVVATKSLSGVVKGSIRNDRSGTRTMILKTEENAITAYETYHGLRLGGMAPGDAIRSLSTRGLVDQD